MFEWFLEMPLDVLTNSVEQSKACQVNNRCTLFLPVNLPGSDRKFLRLFRNKLEKRKLLKINIKLLAAFTRSDISK